MPAVEWRVVRAAELETEMLCAFSGPATLFTFVVWLLHLGK